MVSRRQFIEMAAAASAAGWTGAAASLEPSREGAAAPVAVFDRHIPASRAFVQRASTAGWRLLELRPDVGALWYHTLLPELATALYPLAGLTLESDYFLLKQLTAGLGMCVTWERRHAGGDALVSWALAPPVSRAALLRRQAR